MYIYIYIYIFIYITLLVNFLLAEFVFSISKTHAFIPVPPSLLSIKSSIPF